MDGQSTLTGSASLSDQVQVLISELVTQLIKDVSEQYEAGLTAQLLQCLFPLFACRLALEFRCKAVKFGFDGFIRRLDAKIEAHLFMHRA